jgi:hypothetical protein
MSKPAARDTLEKTPNSRADGNHDSYPSDVAMVDTEDRLHVTLAQHAREGKFTVVKLGADWCKPCVRVRCSWVFYVAVARCHATKTKPRLYYPIEMAVCLYVW